MPTPANIIICISNVFCGVLIIAIAIPLLRGRVKPNRFYGVRFEEAFESEEAWLRINRYGAKRLIIWAFPLIAIGVATLFIPLQGKPWLTPALALAPLIVLIPALQTWLYARRSSKEAD